MSREPVLQGLLSSPKYLPTWYQYDEAGSKMFEEAAYANPFYYIYKSELQVLEQHKTEMTESVRSPYAYMDLGCGKMKKSRLLIDAMIRTQGNLKFYPVDISEKTLKDACRQIGQDYDSRLSVNPVVGDFAEGVHILRNNINGRMFISCLGGTLQILPFDDQVSFLQKLSDAMTAKLPWPLTLKRGEYIRLSSSQSISYKYSLDQIYALAEKGGMRVQQIWPSPNGHIACVLLRKVSV